jgi:anti-sigma regulatory factor (Ser/Thr protein kinase)
LADRSTVHALDLGAALSDLARAARWAAALGEAGLVPQGRLKDVELCLEEALANIITHGLAATASPRIRLRLSTSADRLLLEIEDNGAPFDPVSFVPPPQARTLEEARPGGSGITLMRKFSDGMGYARKDGLNCLSLSFAPAPALDTGVKPGGSSKPGR